MQYIYQTFFSLSICLFRLINETDGPIFMGLLLAVSKSPIKVSFRLISPTTLPAIVDKKVQHGG